MSKGEPARGTSSPVIELDGVHVCYPGSTAEALVGVTLSIQAGEHVCILGGNGSGKSTLLQLINVLALPSAGTVRVCEIDTAEPGRALDIRRRTACVFQHPEDQMVTSVVADDVAFGPENLCLEQPLIAQRVDESLAAVGMTGRALSDPADLSGGQVQRVAIAGALAMNPQILLLDEPCAMLDVEGRAAVRALIARANASGITVVHITHFAEDALAAGRTIVLEHGRVAYDGEPMGAVRLLGLDRDEAEEDKGVRAFREVAGAEAPATNEEPSAAANGNYDDAARDAAEPVVVFDHVSFSYTAAKNPRRREKKGLLSSLFGNKARVTAQTRAAGETRIATEAQAAGAARAAAGGRSDRSAQGGQDSPTGPSPKTPLAQNALADSRSGSPLALNDLSFEARPGTLTALIGRTGSGKSTTAELACALKLPTAGSVSVHGIDTADLGHRRELRRLVGYVSQLPERQLFAETVFDDVAFGPRNLGLSEEEVAERVRTALRSVNLDPTPDLLSRSPFALSGGQQRSVALAGVLAMGQPVLVLDEPMAGLDPAGRAQVRSLIRRLKSTGTTLIMVTHSLTDVAALADQAIALEEGRAIAHGEPAEVIAAVRSRAEAAAAAQPGEEASHGAAR